MSRMSDLVIDIENLYTEGYSVSDISKILDVDYELVSNYVEDFISEATE